MNFYNINEAKKLIIDYPDIYFKPEYGEACEFSDNSKWELCQYKDLIYVYLKRPYIFENETYYDLITPYGYSGFYYQNQENYEEFLPIFREEAKKRNYLTEVVRQNPYINININNYNLICEKELFSVETNNFEDYYKNKLDGKKRNMYKKGEKLSLIFKITDITNKNFKEFLNLYNFTMDKLNADKYYYFNKEYYEKIKNMNYIKIAYVKENEKIIGVSLIFFYNNFIHYHLSANNNSCNCITDFLLINLVKDYCINKKLILGCGNEFLSRFKKKLSTHSYNYKIYKNILNKEIYDKINKNREGDFFPLHLQ